MTQSTCGSCNGQGSQRTTCQGCQGNGQVYHGATPQTCPQCGGSREGPPMTCGACGGSGRVSY